MSINCRSARAVVSIAIASLAACSVTQAQDPYPQQQPAPAPLYQPQDPASLQQPAPRVNPVRQLFVGTLSAILQGVTGGLITSLPQAVTGSITNWFDRKLNKNQGQQYAQSYPQSSYPQSTYPQGTATTDPYATASQYPQGTTYPTQGTQDPYAAYPTSNTYDPYATQYYDPRTGAAASNPGYAYPSADSSQNSLYAGVAYEVHALDAGGNPTPVNAATHTFRTGDRFMVYFRPSLPGRMEVYNINPLGVQTRIDSVEMAAGQLSTLGPYQFAANKGDEALRLMLSPCSTPQLLTQTRDIVNVSATSTQSGNFSLSSCSGIATRSADSVRTRDIQKVAVDGTTSFALDPVSQNEYASGDLSPREITIVFHHR